MASHWAHTEKSFLAVLEFEVLIRELLTIDGLPSSSIPISKVATLNHELLDDTVESRALVSKTLLASGQRAVLLSEGGTH